MQVEGHLRLEQWKQEDGQRRSKIRVVVEQFRFVDRKPGSGQAGEQPWSQVRATGGKRRKDGTDRAPGSTVPAEEIPISRLAKMPNDFLNPITGNRVYCESNSIPIP